MNGEQGVRRSGRQTSATKFFLPHYDPSYVIPTPKTQTGKAETVNALNNSNELISSGMEAKKRRQTKKSLTDSANKKQKMDVFELHSDDELEGRENLSSFANENNPGSSSSQRSSKKKTQFEKTTAVPKKKSSTRIPKDVPTGPKKRKTKFERINEQLKALGVGPDEENGNCARAAISRGSIKLTGKPSDLDQVILSGTLECGHKCNATLGDLLKQPDYAGFDYENGCQNATVVCDQWNTGKCYSGEGRTYVTRICSGNPTFDSGKFHNHCNRCKTFGKCIGDYREAHCNRCGKHYFAGSGSQFGCERCDGSGGGEDDCVLM